MNGSQTFCNHRALYLSNKFLHFSYLINIIHLFKSQAYYLYAYTIIFWLIIGAQKKNQTKKKQKNLDPLTSHCRPLGSPFPTPKHWTKSTNPLRPLVCYTFFLHPSLSHHMSQRINFSSFRSVWCLLTLKFTPDKAHQKEESGKCCFSNEILFWCACTCLRLRVPDSRCLIEEFRPGAHLILKYLYAFDTLR